MPPGPYQATDYIRLFAELFERGSDPVLITSAREGTIIDANPAFLSLFALTRTQTIGHTSEDLGLWVDPASREAVRRSTLDAGQVQSTRVRARGPWSEEFSVDLTTVKVPWRGEEAIVGFGRIVVDRPGVESRAARHRRVV